MTFEDATFVDGVYLCSCFGTDENTDPEVTAFVDQAVAWVKERDGHVVRKNRYEITIYGDDLAFEFRLRWC